MSFGRILVILIVSLALYLTVKKEIKKEIKKDKPFTTKRVIKLILFPFVLLYGLFMYGYIYLYPEFYTFLAWNLSPDLITKASWLILVAMVVNGFMLYYLPDKTIDILNEDDIASIAHSDNRKRDAIISATILSLKAGLKEEIIFRFSGFFVLLAVVSLFDQFAPFSITNLVLLSPSWLSLEVEGMIPATPFTALFLSNLIFAVLHLESADGKWKITWIHRVVFSWFFGWVYVLALIQLGFAGAVFTHFIIDLISFVPLFVVRFEQIAKKYWNRTYRHF